jgi:DNA-binding transcriptional MerR regulator
MRISELSRETGVPVATIKYYLREGLLPPGDPSAANQASYRSDHLHRLRLIRTLRDVGGLGIERVRRVLAAIDDPELDRHDLYGAASAGLEGVASGAVDASVLATLPEIDAFIARRGWRVRPNAPTRVELAAALTALRRLGRRSATEIFDPYADTAERLAAWEVETIPAELSAAEALEQMIVGTVIFERVLGTLRRMAHEHHSSELHGVARERDPV